MADLEKVKQYYLSYNLKTCARAKIPPAGGPINFYAYDVLTNTESYHSTIAGPIWVGTWINYYVWDQMVVKFNDIIEYFP